MRAHTVCPDRITSVEHQFVRERMMTRSHDKIGKANFGRWSSNLSLSCLLAVSVAVLTYAAVASAPSAQAKAPQSVDMMELRDDAPPGKANSPRVMTSAPVKVNVTTYHYDNRRNGWNNAESLLTPRQRREPAASRSIRLPRRRSRRATPRLAQSGHLRSGDP